MGRGPKESAVDTRRLVALVLVSHSMLLSCQQGCDTLSLLVTTESQSGRSWLDSDSAGVISQQVRPP